MGTSGKYDDIIHLSRPESPHRARMSMVDRGAQFSPFAALTGYDAVIRETGRLTDRQIELTDSGKEQLDEKLRCLHEAAPTRPEATFLCFEHDPLKAGGRYISVSGRVKSVDQTAQTVTLTDGTTLSMEQILEISCAIMEALPEKSPPTERKKSAPSGA